MVKLFIRINVLIILAWVIYACKPASEKITPDSNARLEFSRDTILFDTLFTSIGSSFRRLTVFNPNENAVKISSINVGGLASSEYNVIINGRESHFESDVELRGKDSLFILVRVNINPQNQELPYLVKDSILFLTNSNLQKVMLVAYGQDANFITNKTLDCNTTWDSPKPYVIYGHASIPEGCSLTIKPGTRILFSEKSHLQVNGTLIAEGEEENEVIFSSDKLTQRLKNQPGLWSGIIFGSSSTGNQLKKVKIRNAENGIRVKNSGNPATPSLVLDKVIIENMSFNGIKAINAHVSVQNTLIHNCAAYAFQGSGGGTYTLLHVTLANYSFNFFRNGTTLLISDTYFSEDGTKVQNPVSANFTNCIIWGDKTEELTMTKSPSGLPDHSFTNCLLRTRLGITGENNLLNTDPEFDSPRQGTFVLRENSPAISAAIDAGITTDLAGKTRPSPPSIGAYEH
ncbi:MAG: choice-of-anchor Q domain-containing protein [Cytophagaceae bacterium]